MKRVYTSWTFPVLSPRFSMLLLLMLGIFYSAETRAQINVSNIDIVRDKWGVPHIYGKTDAEAAYGLAWATSEDDFRTVQRMLLAVKGKLGEVDGQGGAILDFLAFIAGVDRVVAEQYDTALSAQYKKVLDAYAEGLNAYASLHPGEVLRKGVFPINAKDIIKEYVLTNVLLTSVYLDIQKIFTGDIKLYEENYPSGSNALAFNHTRTQDGKTYLAVNSHQPLEGMFSWYEAHINSEEGLNMLGATFPGGASIFVGTNPELGWACTLNHPDMDDVYKLDMNPRKSLQYWFDDHWETLEVRKKTVKVKLGPIRLPITKTFYWSKYGTTLESHGSYYAVRFAANMDIKSSEQMYRMNKAKSFSEWRNIMRTNHIPGMNFMYADRRDTIFYVSASQMPYRSPAFNWKKVLPGNTSATLWPARFHAFDSIPQILNPGCGYMVSTNNSCFDVCKQEFNLKPENFDATYGYGTEKNNRSIMAHFLIGKYDKLSYDDFKRVKFNRAFNDSMYDYNLDNVMTMMNLSPVKYPELADAIAVLRSWDHQSDPGNKEASLASFALYNLIDIISAKGNEYENNRFPERAYAEALREAKHHMMQYFGSLRVPLGDVQKHVRGNVALPVGGVPEVLAATISQPYKNGMRRTYVGDSYIELIRYSKDSVQIESINAFGASAKPNSPHYTDQMQMFVDQKLKPMTLDKETIYRNAEHVYHPGKEKEEKDHRLFSKL
jgi:acyl-homoserine-lactone acylase